MKKNLKIRSIVIAVTILICVIGIIGLPKSKAELKENFSQNIRLGLDLKGGSHLVLQVQVQDAVKADAETTAERLKEELKKQNITWASMDVTEPKDIADADRVEIAIKGIPSTQSSAFRSLVSERYSTFVLTAVNSTDYTMRLSPTELINLKRETVERTKDTISNRIDQLGLAEKAVQQYGASGSAYKLLVQLPGVDDPQRVKDLIGTAAVLELVDVKDGPFPSRDALLAQHGGVLPLNTRMAKAIPRGGSEGEQWYLVSKGAVITGREMRNARPSQDEFRKWETNFTLSPDGGKRFGRFTEANIGNRLAVVLDNQIVSVANIHPRLKTRAGLWASAASRKPRTSRVICGPVRFRRA